MKGNGVIEVTPRADFNVRHGNTGVIGNPAGLVFTFVGETMTGRTYHFRAVARGQEVLAKVATVAGTTVTVPITIAESRTIPVGSLTRYELEQRVDGQEVTRVHGFLIGVEGVNDDAEP